MSKNYVIYMAMASFALSSCVVTERLKFWEGQSRVQPIAFQISGLDKTQEDQKQTREYIQGIIADKMVFEPIEENEKLDESLARFYARATQKDILRGMQAKGYYRANVDISIQDTNNDMPQVLFDISPGTQAKLTAISVIPARYMDNLDTIQLKPGSALEADAVLKAQARLYKQLQEKSCAVDLDISHQVIFDSDMQNGEVVFKITEGKPAAFGALSFTGNDTVKTKHIDKLVSWDQGACYKQNKVEAVRAQLLASGLFSRVSPVLPDNASQLDTIPVTIELTERPHRTLSAGLSYYTDEELGVSFGWEHRNFRGAGEKLKVDFNLSKREQELTTTLNKPFFLREDQNLTLNASLTHEDTDAYESTGVSLGGFVSRSMTDQLTARIGTEIDVSRIEENNGQRNNYAILTPRSSLKYDSRDNTLDPRDGALLKISAAPSIDMIGTSDPYLTTQASAQSYYEANKNLVLAGRIKAGTIWGASTQNLPASKRFYAGGGGSVRGFGYQEIGPFENGDPLGGRSLLETSLELRYKMTEKIGAVAFVDAGQVDDDVAPAFDDLAVGAGLGLRYYTDFGPLRFDVATPLGGDENSDQSVHFYVSIGQAF
ncbi:MAG: autotransporter assembly complex protein TamA [Alphaproteobacteria bacterium]